MALLSIENLTFTYPLGVKPTLHSLNLEVERGDFIVVTGSVASGKSTFLRLLKPELQPAGELIGEILFQGEPLGKLTDKKSATAIGFVQQDPSSQLVTPKVWTELAFGLENIGVASDEIRSRVAEISHYFGLSQWFDREVQTLSLGQKQLLNLAGTVIMRPDVLILDEPTAHLDPIAAAEFRQTLIKLNQELQLTIILVEHQLDEVVGVADRIVVFTSGHISLNEHPTNLGMSAIKAEEASLPLVMKLYANLNMEGPVPLTLKDGRDFLQKNFQGTSQLKPKQKQMQGPKVLTVRQLSFAYERRQSPVLVGLDLQLYAGEIFSLVGSNGVGKSTLLKTLAGVLKPQKGKVSFKDKKVGYLPQEVQGLFLGETLLEDLEIYSQQLTLTKVEFKENLSKVTLLFPVENILKRPLTDLSGGQLQLAALTKLLFIEKDVLLLDEPTKGLDSQHKKQLAQLLIGLRQQGKTLLIVTHDLDFAAEVSDRCGLFFQGQIIGSSQPEEFFQQHYFYTTTTHRIGRELYPTALTPEELLRLCLEEGGQVYETN